MEDSLISTRDYVYYPLETCRKKNNNNGLLRTVSKLGESLMNKDIVPLLIRSLKNLIFVSGLIT